MHTEWRVRLARVVAAAVVVAPLSAVSPWVAGPARAAVPTVNEQYFAGAEHFKAGRLREASELWSALLDQRRAEMSAKQVAAVTQRLAQTQELLKTCPEPPKPLSPIEEALRVTNEASKLLAGQTAAERAQAETLLNESMGHLEKAAEAGQQDPRFPYLMASAMIYTGRADEAGAFVQEALRLQPKDPRPLNLKAERFARLGKRTEEIATLEASLALNPKQTTAHYRLAKALLARGSNDDIDEAMRHAEASVGRSKERARELAGLFPDRALRERLEALAVQIAMEDAHRVVVNTPKDGKVQSFFGGGNGIGSVSGGSSGGGSRSGSSRSGSSSGASRYSISRGG